MGKRAKPKIPRLIPGADVTRLPLGPTEGFVLSRIDGSSSVEEIADMTGLSAGDVGAVVDQLIEADVAEWVEPIHPRARHSTVPRGTPSRGTLRTKPAPPHTSRTLYDPQELEEPDVDLDVERRRIILDTFYRLDEISFYELLGVEEGADKAEIRAGYFALSKKFHPDTLYGKRLGSYRKKMETVFKALTEAYEVLGKKRSRSEYDAYLKLRKRTQAAERSLGEAARQAERIEKATDRAAERMVVSPEGAPAEPSVTGAPLEEPPPVAEAGRDAQEDAAEAEASAEHEPSAPRAPSAEAMERQRRLLAKKLAAATGRRMPGKQPADTMSLPPEHRSSSNPPGVVEGGGDRESLLRGLASSLKHVASVTGGVDRTQKLVADADRAEAEGNLVEAANSMRMAVALSPERVDLSDRYDRLRQQLAQTLSETYEQQAQYEERAGRWAEAALSWSKVCDGRPNDAHAHRRTAVAMVEAGGDLAKAKTYAQKAVDLLPEDARARRALGRVFYAAGMSLNAKRELEKAAKLDPSDEIVKNLLRELEKGGPKR